MEADWLVLVGADGVVYAALGGAPAAWVAHRIDDCPGVTEATRIAAQQFVHELAHRVSTSPLHYVRIPREAPDGPTITLLSVDAVPLRLAEVEPAAVVRRALRSLESQARALDVALVVEIANDLPSRSVMDGEKFAWTVTALVGNALRHVRHGTTAMPGGTISVHLRHAVAPQRIVVTVEDDGSGIAPALRPWLFEPDPSTGETAGLALRLVHDVVRAHGGAIVVKSSTAAEDRGTAVTLWLPVRP